MSLPVVARIVLGILLALNAAACELISRPQPAPTNCWVGFRAEYRLVAADGTDAGAAAIEEAARIINARISRIGFAEFLVRFRSDGVIEVELPTSADQIDVGELIRPTGDLAFVPIPEGISVGDGDPIPPELAPLFGRDALREIRPGVDQQGQSALDIELTPGAALAFADYTGRNIGQQFALVLDGVVLSAPVIQAPIQDGHAQISGGIDVDVANRLAVVLSLPRLPGTLHELSFSAVDPARGCSRV